MMEREKILLRMHKLRKKFHEAEDARIHVPGQPERFDENLSYANAELQACIMQFMMTLSLETQVVLCQNWRKKV